MKTKEATKLAITLLLIMFMIKGVLSDFGVGRRFDAEQIYSFAYMGVAISTYLFFNSFLSEPEDKDATETPQ